MLSLFGRWLDAGGGKGLSCKYQLRNRGSQDSWWVMGNSNLKKNEMSVITIIHTSDCINYKTRHTAMVYL